MAINRRPYELSVWVEQLNGSNSKIEKKGIIIGAHDMSYLGKATNLVLKRDLKGTNTLTFQMPDRYFDSLSGEYVRNEFIDMLYNEAKLKLFYNDRWYEFFIKKIDEKKQLKSYMKTFTCSDAFIDELSRNGYGITYDTDLYNNVEEIGTFSERTLDESIWQYHPENNWGDFTEYKEEKLYRIPVSCFGGSINGYKLNFELDPAQLERIEEEKGTKMITNPFTGDARAIELSDDMARGYFWDEYNEHGDLVNSLIKEFHEDIPNDGYIYVPYSCLGFCYGSKEEPDFSDELKYDRAATETAIDLDGELILAPQSIDPRTIIQFYAIPETGILQLDDGGVIMNKDYTYFMTLSQWNNSVHLDADWWYMFEDTRLVHAEVLGSADVDQPCISHTFKYLKDGRNQILNTDYESRGNKCVTYDGYLSDVNENYIVKGKKFSITNRTEVNISEEIDQYTTVYNCHADDFKNEFSSEDWDYNTESRTSTGEQYRVCSKLETRQVIPQLARNLIQNGIKMDSVDGWSPMSYLIEEKALTTPMVIQHGVIRNEDDESISSSCLLFSPTVAQIAYKGTIKCSDAGQIPNAKITCYSSNPAETLPVSKLAGNTYDFYTVGNSPTIAVKYMEPLINKDIYLIGTKYYQKIIENGVIIYSFLFEKGDAFHRALMTRINGQPLFTIDMTTDIEVITPDENNEIKYYIQGGAWDTHFSGYDNPNTHWGRKMDEQPEEKIVTLNEEGSSLINFGIIGQQKIIEKEKIYCLGVQAIPKPSTDDTIAKSFKIKIGRGALVSEGNYQIAEDAIEFNYDDGILAPSTFDWGLSGADEDGNILIANEPPTRFVLFKTDHNIENPYFTIECEGKIILLKLFLFEAYTKGIDCFAQEDAVYRYSGRDLFWPPKDMTLSGAEKEHMSLTQAYNYPPADGELNIHKYIIFEDDIMLGSSYGYQHYYIQRLKANLTENNKPKTVYCDTMGQKSYLSSDIKEIKENSLPLDAAKCTSDDYEIQTNYIDLSKCSFYNQEAAIDECDCMYSGGHTCFYQKFGYCPYRFKPEKHNRRVRTLSVSKSNRFNIIQSISKVFEVYPQFYIEHKPNGSVIKNEDNEYLKKVFFITEKGRENKIGFRYEKNLKDINRNVVSDQIVTKLYVLDVDSELSRTGLCSIKTAEDNISKDNYLIDLRYYVEKGMLDANEVEQDLYGVTPTKDVLSINDIPSGFLRQLGYYNNQYDELSNKIINLQDASFTELEANLTVNYQGIITSQEQILKIKKQIDRYKEAYRLKPQELEEQQVFQNYLVKLAEQQSILARLIDLTFFTDGVCDDNPKVWEGECFKPDGITSSMTPVEFFEHISDLEMSKDFWIEQHKYTKGILGQFNSEYLQIQQWKRERASYLKLINQISTAFYRKYEPYLKEGTWSDDNYLTDNAYYFGALDVSAEGSIPKVTYSINVIDLAPLGTEYEEVYDFDLADITYVEDIGMFGINKHTGFPNRLKVLISSISESLDDPSKNSIQVQNFTTSFQDLFEQVTASVQSLTYNENIYKRSSNFTSLQNITKSSLQGTLDTNDLVLLDTDENNIQVDSSGTSGSDINNHANKYRLDGQGLFFSNDGGQHWSVGVGPSGINADYIRVGTLDAGKIRIADSSYVYFSWDKNGITAYRDPQAISSDEKNLNDAAIFNKYGLSIVEGGKIKLRAGYAFNGSQADDKGGLISTEETMGDEIGFYLYNSDGKVIFSTSTVKDEMDAGRQSASLKLVGEMLVTDGVSQAVATQFEYSRKWTFQDILWKGAWSGARRYTEIGNLVTEEQEDGTQISYYTKPNGYSLDEAAAINMWKTNTTSVAMREGVNVGPIVYYTQESFVDDQKDNRYLFMTDDGNRYENVPNLYTMVLNSSRNSGSITVMWLPLSGNHHILDDGNAYVPAQRYLNTDVGAKVTTNTQISPQTIDYIRFNNGTQTRETKSLYFVNGSWYENVSGDPGSMSQQDASVALYLNNPSLSSDIYSKTDRSFTQRMFVCCAQDGSNIRNLFTVLKDGTAYFGGYIQNQSASTATDLQDYIKINNPGIRIDHDGMHLSFGSIKDENNNSLPDYIAQQINDSIASSSGPLYDAIARVVNQVNNTSGSLQSQIDWIIAQISNQAILRHNHDIDWGTLNYGSPSYDKPGYKVKVKVEISQGGDEGWCELGQLIKGIQFTGG